MAATFRGFLSRDQVHLSLGCSPFEFNTDVGKDLLVDESGNDPGVFTRAHELLRPYQRSHERAIVALDCEWNGSPGKDVIVDSITKNLVSTGWHKDMVKVIAIEPELENWIWQDNPLIAQALRYKGTLRLRNLLEQEGLWPADQLKPTRPKEATEWVLRLTGRPRSSSIYEELAGRVSIRGCSDAAFHELHAALRLWFPVRGEA